jgi:alpha-ketoglutarate-dependent taurine dioxygenase
MTNFDKPQGPSKLKAFKRKSVVVSVDDLVSCEASGGGPPAVFRPTLDRIELPAWIARSRDVLRAKLHEHGAVLFRGFAIPTLDTFSDAVRGISGEPLHYTERSSPRHAVSGNVYTSTDYPSAYPIFLHNEQSYNLRWCRVISFHCQKAATRGGQTPLADTRRILARLDRALVEQFRQRRYIYQRNFGDGFGLSWQVAFQTESRADVEAYCRANRIEVEWKQGDRLRTRQVRDPVHRHPETGASVWFNHCAFFHVSTLPAAVRDALLGGFAEEDLPNQTLWGDGASIEADVMAELQQAYLAEKVMFDWQEGDVLIVDNMLCCHGREPFEGERRVLTIMSELSDGPADGMDGGT